MELENTLLRYKKISNKILIEVNIGWTLVKFIIINQKTQ